MEVKQGYGWYCWSSERTRLGYRLPTRIQKPALGSCSRRCFGFLPRTICASSATLIEAVSMVPWLTRTRTRASERTGNVSS